MPFFFRTETLTWRWTTASSAVNTELQRHCLGASGQDFISLIPAASLPMTGHRQLQPLLKCNPKCLSLRSVCSLILVWEVLYADSAWSYGHCQPPPPVDRQSHDEGGPLGYGGGRPNPLETFRRLMPIFCWAQLANVWTDCPQLTLRGSGLKTDLPTLPWIPCPGACAACPLLLGSPSGCLGAALPLSCASELTEKPYRGFLLPIHSIALNHNSEEQAGEFLFGDIFFSFL